jgi:glutathione S-transferase
MAHTLTALVTLAALATYFWTMINVGKARGQYNVNAPDIEGAPEFNRIHRVQVNTGEQLILFLPALWLFAVVGSDVWAALIGLVWIVGRVLYARAYYVDPPTRARGMFMTVGSSGAPLLGSLIGLLFTLF